MHQVPGQCRDETDSLATRAHVLGNVTGAPRQLLQVGDFEPLGGSSVK